MQIKKWFIDIEYTDQERGIDNFGHYETEDLSDDQVQEVVVRYLHREYFSNIAQLTKTKKILIELYKDISSRTDIEELFGDEIAEYFGGEKI